MEEPGKPARWSVSVSRHDHHNIEIKTNVELGREKMSSDFEVYVMAPANFQLSAYSKVDIQRDIRSTARLSIPRESDAGAIELKKPPSA